MEFLSEDINAPGDIAGSASPNVSSHGSRSVLKERNSNELKLLSPLTSKSATAIKLSPSPRPQIQTPITPTAYALPSPTAAAGSATLGTDSTIYKFHIDAELEAELLGESKPLAQENNNNTGVNKSNKFVGLTEFDESNIPELPDSLNPNIDDQLKLTFEEDLIPTFTANSIAGLNSTSKRDVNIKGLLVNETDTAVSSDNETFAECLSFQDIVNTTTAAKNALEYGNTTEMSDADTYRSALNSNNTTIGLGDQLNETLENVEDIVDEQLSVNFEPSLRELVTSRNNNEEQSVSPLPTNSKQNYGEHQFEDEVGVAAADVTFDEVEPMDVDMNETIDLPTTSNAPLTVETGAMSGSEAAHTMNTRVSITPEMTLSSTSVGNVSEHNRLTYALKRAQDQSSGPALVTPGNSQSLGSLGNVSEHNRLTFSVERPTGLSSSPALVPPRNSHSLDSLGNVSEHNRLTFSLARAEEQPNRPASATPENSSSLGSLGNTSNSRLTFSLERHEEQPNVARSDAENQLERSFMSNNECENIEVPFNQAIARVANECIIQDNSIDSATDVLPVSFEEEEEDVDEHNGISDSTSACGENQREGNTSVSDVATIENKLEVPHTSHNNVERNLNLTLNVNCSLDMGNKSFPNSPTFPVKAKMDKKQFPRSPVNENLTAVLEKSDYTEKLMKSPEIASAIKEDDLKYVNNLNETVDISDVVAQAISTVASARKSLSLLTHSADSIDNKNSSSVSLNTVGNNLNDTVDMSDIGAQGISSRPSPRTSFCLPVDHSVESIENNNASPVNVNSVAANKLNDTVDLSDIAAKEISPMPSPRTPLNAPVHTSDTPVENDSSSSANINGNEMPSPPIASSMMGMTSKANEKRRTFNIASPPVEEDLGKKSENRSSPNRFADKRRTFKMSPQQETDSFEPMDFDESMQFSAAQQFPPISNLILNPSDFDYLLTKGNNNVQVDRSSLLLKFDPLLGKPIPVDQPHLGRAQLSPTGEEDEHQNESNCSFVVDDNFAKELEEVSVKLKHRSLEVAQEFSQIQAKPKKNVRMSVDVINDMNIENDCKKSIENLNTQSDEKQSNFKMDELEKKIKNEVLKTEDIEKKLKEAELREEALIKRITEKDKTITKMNGVIEAYEKAIAELISEKEQLIQNYEKQLAEVKADRDSNYHHLTSLETTFSDLHVKYEKSKEMTSQLKSSEEALLSEKKQNLENLRLQEKRYEKMKNHAMQQLEIANKKLESLTHEHAIETTKLKALLKKEEISRASINEQLQQKTRENAELVKICDELINGR